MVRARIEIEGAERAALSLEKIADRVDAPLGPVLAAIGQNWSSAFQDAIRTGVLDLPEPHPATSRIREHYGHGGKPRLFRGGQLLHDIRPLAFGDDFVEVGADLPYARVVQSGGRVTGTRHRDERGRFASTGRGERFTREVRPHPFIVVSDELVDDTVETLTEYFFPPDA